MLTVVTAISSCGSSGFERGDCWKCTNVRSGRDPVEFPTGIWSNSSFCDGYILKIKEIPS